MVKLPWCLISICLAIGSTIFVMVSLISYVSDDLSCMYDTTERRAVGNSMGTYGAHVASLLLYFFGCSVLLIIPLMFMVIVSLMLNCPLKRNGERYVAFLGIVGVCATLAHIYACEIFVDIYPGGLIGSYAYSILLAVLEPTHIYAFLFMLSWSLYIVIIRLSLVFFISPVLCALNSRVRDGINTVIYPVGEKVQYLKNSFLKSIGISREKNNIKAIYKDPFWNLFVHSTHPLDSDLEHQPEQKNNSM
jgi:4TM region of DNA translocase FtsK/SpoIIIE